MLPGFCIRYFIAASFFINALDMAPYTHSVKGCPGLLFLGIFVFNIPITIRKHFENTGPVDCIQQRPKGIFEIYIYTGGI